MAADIGSSAPGAGIAAALRSGAQEIRWRRGAGRPGGPPPRHEKNATPRVSPATAAAETVLLSLFLSPTPCPRRRPSPGGIRRRTRALVLSVWLRALEPPPPAPLPAPAGLPADGSGGHGWPLRPPAASAIGGIRPRDGRGSPLPPNLPRHARRPADTSPRAIQPHATPTPAAASPPAPERPRPAPPPSPRRVGRPGPDTQAAASPGSGRAPAACQPAQTFSASSGERGMFGGRM